MANEGKISNANLNHLTGWKRIAQNVGFYGISGDVPQQKLIDKLSDILGGKNL